VLRPPVAALARFARRFRAVAEGGGVAGDLDVEAERVVAIERKGNILYSD
jgi:hypothetical protein